MRSVSVPFLLSLLLANGGAYVLAYRDQSFLALAIAFFGGPAVNGILALLGAIVAWKQRAQPGAMTVIQAILIPVAFLIVLEVAVFHLDLHGC